MHTGFVPAFIKLYITCLVGLKISDKAFHNRQEEGELWEPATVYSPTRRGTIPHELSNETLKQMAYEEEYLTSKRQISLGAGTKSYVKF
jgi:hypothetical protein